MPVESRVESRLESTAARAIVVSSVLAIATALAFVVVRGESIALALFGSVVVGEAVRPLVVRLRAWMPRSATVAVAFGLVFAALGLVWVAPFQALAPQISAFVSSLPVYVADATARVTTFSQDPQHAKIAGAVSSIAPSAGNWVLRMFLQAQGSIAATLGTASLALVMAPFWLGASEILAAFSLSLVPPAQRRAVAGLFSEISGKLGSYVVSTVVNGAIVALECVVVLVVLRAPYPIVLGVLQGLLIAVPYIGSLIGLLIVAVVVLAAQGWVAAAVTVLAISLVYSIQGTFVSPLIFKRSLDIDPLVTIVATSIGGTLFGILGVVLAVPAASILQTVVVRAIAPAIRSHYAATSTETSDET